MLTQFPTQVSAGLSLQVPILGTTYPAPTWTVSAVLRGPEAIDLAAVAEGDDHCFQETAAVTGGWAAGTYTVSIRATDGADVHEIERGQIEILADLVAVPAGEDQRGHAAKVLASIEKLLEGRATSDVASYTINGRQLTKMSITDLIALRKAYRAEAAKEAGTGSAGKILRRKVRANFRV